MPTKKPRYPRAYSYYIPVSDANYEWLLQLNKGLSEPIWSIRRQVAVHTIMIGKLDAPYPNPLDCGEVETILAYFDREQWLPIMLDHEGFLLDGQHRLEVCCRKELFFVDAVVRCADHERIHSEAKKRWAVEEKAQKHKRQDFLGDWLTRKEWKERYGTRIRFGENW